MSWAKDWMHADIIVIGQRSEAYLASFLFAKRGYRTLLLTLPGMEFGPGHNILVGLDLADRLRPASPPAEAILSRHFSLELWSPDERARANVVQLPFLLVDEEAYCRSLERQAMATRNFRVLRGLAPSNLDVKNGVVSGVGLPSGDLLGARAVVECNALSTPLIHQLSVLWPQPSLAPFTGVSYARQRRVGAAASAWDLGTMSMRIKSGRHVSWQFRFAPELVEFGALIPPGSTANAKGLVARAFREAGLEAMAESGQRSSQRPICAPLPVPIAPGYVAVGAVAGCGNPFLPMDRTASLTGVAQAHLAVAGALEERTTGLSGLWEYVRAMASDGGRNQAFVYALSSALMRMDSRRLEALLQAGTLDTYALSCLLLGRLLDEGVLDSLGRQAKLLGRPGALAQWLKMVRHARRLSAAYAQVPAVFERSAALAWQESVLKLW
jgi:hypothetical protein